MFKKTILSAVVSTAALSYSAVASDAIVVDTESKVEALIVSGFAIKNTNIDKIIFFSNIHQSCVAKSMGYYSFVDIEGGNINRLKKHPLVSANDSLDISESEYKMQVKNVLTAAKKDYCVDVALAPMMDVGYTNRSYFLEEYQIEDKLGTPEYYYIDDDEHTYSEFKAKREWEKRVNKESKRIHADGLSRISAYIDAAHDVGIMTSLKHYPLSFYPDMEQLDAELSEKEKNKWTEKDLLKGYSEIITRSNKHDNENFEQRLRSFELDLINKLSENDMIMLSSYQFDFTNYVPYVASESPQNDKVLQGFNGLIITDDLYQLNVEDNDISNIFLSSDLFIITSMKDLRIFIEKVTYLAEHNELFKKELDKKYNKVITKFPRIERKLK